MTTSSINISSDQINVGNMIWFDRTKNFTLGGTSGGWGSQNPTGGMTMSSNYDLAPDGTNTATRLQWGAGGQIHFYPNYRFATGPGRANNPVTPNSTYTMSWWFKGIASEMSMSFGEYSSGQAFIKSTYLPAYLAVPSGTWTLVTATITMGAATFYSVFDFYTTLSSPVPTDMLVWGAKIEQSTSSSATPNTYLTNPSGYSLVGTSWDGMPRAPRPYPLSGAAENRNILLASQARYVGYEGGPGQWFKGSSTSSMNYALAPNGFVEATRYQTPSGTSGQLSPRKPDAGDVGSYCSPGIYNMSLWVKDNGSNLSPGLYFHVDFIDATGSATGVTGSSDMYSLINSNTWTRVSHAFAVPNGTSYAILNYCASYLQTWNTDVFIWGAKFETGSIATGDQWSI